MWDNGRAAVVQAGEYPAPSRETAAQSRPLRSIEVKGPFSEGPFPIQERPQDVSERTGKERERLTGRVAELDEG